MELMTLLQKYDVPTPRYTSYPTVPFWDNDGFDEYRYLQRLQNSFYATNNPEQGISIYIHLPYCESLCTYCGCNKRITTNHDVEMPYIKAVLAEWKMYKALFDSDIYIAELHLGGGTPSFFSAKSLDYLLSNLLEDTYKANHFEFSIEVHPNHLNEEQLAVLSRNGFKRISIGVQDVDPVVQKAIHRIQTIETTTLAIQKSRKAGFTSVNIDLVYGLPKQSLESMKMTLDAVLDWKPERIALYSYAHVPWKSRSQRGFDENDLPKAQLKWEMFSFACQKLIKSGYIRVGMDHFALPTDALAIAQIQKTLHRNFMGYTPNHTQVLIGLGASSISDCGNGFVQNEKDIDNYLDIILTKHFPFEKGHLHTQSECWTRKQISNIMCHNFTEWNKEDAYASIMIDALVALQSFKEDGLVELASNSIRVTPKGELFVRNICHCLDQSQHYRSENVPVFSKAI